MKVNLKVMKYLRRPYTILEHSLIVKSLMKSEGIKVNKVVDVYRRGFMQIHVDPSYIDRSESWLEEQIEKDPDFVKKINEKGMELVEKSKYVHTLDEIKNFVDEFSKYHEMGYFLKKLKIDQDCIEFQKIRGKIFSRVFRKLKKIKRRLAWKYKVRNLNRLTYDELLDFLDGKKFDIKGRKSCIIIFTPEKTEIKVR